MLARGQLKHQYPHSWRSKAPLIFRNTPQWFIALDKPYQAGAAKTLRQVALAEIERVDWGQRRVNDDRDQNRIKAMIEERPDWLISRQRNWGVPLAIFVSKADASILQDDEVDARIIAAMKQERRRRVVVDAGAGFPGRQIQGRRLREGRRHSRCLVRFRLDARLRLGDRERPTRASFKTRRRCFISKAPTSTAAGFTPRSWKAAPRAARAPYDEVITYGFTVAEDGRKMSKSLGNGVEPQEVEKQYGIEPFRLLIAAADYRDELRLGPTILSASDGDVPQTAQHHPLLSWRA